MTDQDLTLLTDEERSLYTAAYSQQHPSYYTIDAWRLVQVFRALIAARAENKQLREALSSLRIEHVMVEDCWYSCPKSDEYCGENKGGECDCGADKHNALLESLFLQSEKGGEE